MNFISVDLGGTNTRIAYAADLEKPVFVQPPVRRRNTHTYDDDLAFIVATAKQLSGSEPIEAVGIGVPGRVNDAKTDMIASHNLPEWTNHHFGNDLSRALRCPVFIDNNGVAAGLGEAYFGSVKSDFHYLIWGTGIGGVSVEHGRNGRITVTYIRPKFQDHFDAWEKECGGAAFLRNYGKPGEELTATEWTNINAVFAHYLRAYIAIANPPAIVFGGGLAIHHAQTITDLSDEVGITIRITEFGEDSGLVGALGLIRNQRGGDL